MPSSTAAIPSPSDVGRAEDDDDDEDIMKLDNTKHKVYIYNIDDELSSEDDDATSDDGRLVFLPDIEKHLRANRIPPQILANADGELAGMQLILYSDPKSLSVPEEQDGVRKAIIEARQRLRDKNSGKEDKSPASPRTETASHVNAATSSGSCSWDANGYCSDSSDAMDMD